MDEASSPLLQLELAVVGVARNCARSIQRDIEVLERATAAFGRVHFLVIESDSTDQSVATLQAMATRSPGFRYRSLGHLRETIPRRTERIAHCRNVYIDELASNPLYATVTHVLVSDLDGVSRHIDGAGLASCWRAGVAWDVCTANQGDHYYDIYALRHPVWCPGDAWQEHDALVPLLGERAATEISLFSRMVHIAPTRPMIEVDSAFGGLAVYARKALLAGRYVGVDAQGRDTCEHVTLHAALRAQGLRICINPAMINARTTRHAGRKKPFRTLRRRLWNWLRRRED
jgi:hypothetical protein